MSRTYIPADTRRQVRDRANHYCEYCLLHEEDTALQHEVDHIIAEKHGGETILENLCYACFICNRNKGSDVASFIEAGILTRFFHPRQDIWSDHFQIDGNRIVSHTDIDKVTVKLFGFNAEERCKERGELQSIGRYPVPPK